MIDTFAMKHSDEHIQHQIESYLNQEMTDLERSKFEKMIHDDPELHDEVEMQEAAMEAIRRERIFALKAGLSQVPISLWSTGLLQVAKIAAISAGIATAGLGGYFLLENTQHTKFEVQQSKVEVSGNKPLDLSTPIDGDSQEPEPVAQTNFDSKVDHSEAPINKLNPESQGGHIDRKESSKVKNSEMAFQGSNTTSEPIEPSIKSLSPQTGKDLANPVDGISNRTSLESVHPEVVIKKDNKNVFHYQFSDGRLVLYADFSEQLYEVLELNQNGEKQIFFCFDNKFFPLNPNQFEISPLKEVQDKNLIQILKAYQKRKN